MATTPQVDPADLRAEIARVGLPMYQVAAKVPINPSQLSRWLRGHDPIPSGAAERVLQVLRDEQGHAGVESPIA